GLRGRPKRIGLRGVRSGELGIGSPNGASDVIGRRPFTLTSVGSLIPGPMKRTTGKPSVRSPFRLHRLFRACVWRITVLVRSQTLAPGAASLLTTEQLADLLRVHPAQVDRLVGLRLPAINIAIPRPGRRPKRALRFDQDAVMRWLQDRANKAQGGN